MKPIINSTVYPISLVVYIFIHIIASNQLIAQDIPAEEKRNMMHAQVRSIELSTESVNSGPHTFLNGKMHIPVTDKRHHPYLGKNEWQKGTVNYNGENFNVRLLKYHILTDHLVVLPYDHRNTFPIALNRNYIRGFELAGRTFTYRPRVDLAFRSIPPGYLEVIYDGKTKFFIKWRKEEGLNNSERQIEYNEFMTMLLWKDGRFYRIRNKLGLIYRLRDNGKEIRKFMRENNIRFNNNTPSAAQRILDYYDNL